MVSAGVGIAVLAAASSLTSVMGSVNISSELTLGWIVTSLLILILGGYVGVRDRRAKKWRDLYDLADTERKEKQHELDEARGKLTSAVKQISEQKEIIAKLDALQMPVRIVEMMNASVERLNTEATVRQGEVRDELRKALMEHESRAADRFAGLMKVLDLIAERLGPDLNGVH